MGMLTARIRKQDQVNRDTVLVKPNKKGGAVRTAAIGNNIDMLISKPFHIGISSAPDTAVRVGGVCRSTPVRPPAPRTASRRHGG